MNAPDLFNSVKLLQEEYIPFPPFDAAIKAINKNINLYRKTGIADHVLITGESGSGKTTLCKWVEKQYPRYREPERDIVPALVISVPPAATIASVAEAMLKKLGDPSYLRGNISSKTIRVITLCKACKVEVLLFDEAQHINDRGKQATHYFVGDWLKSLIEDLAVPSVFLGLPRLALLLQVNEQLRGRVVKRLNLALGQSGTETLEKECFQLFRNLGNALPIPISYSPYNWKKFGLRLAYASDGRVRYIKRLLRVALEYAIEERETVLSPALLERAFTEVVWESGIGALNPFHPAFEFRRLDRGGEPFQKGGL